MHDEEALVQGLLECNKPSELDAIQIPEITRLKEVPQDLQHHPEGNAYIHSMQVLDRAASLRDTVETQERRLAYMLAAWLHDVGKWDNTFYRAEKRRLTHWKKPQPKNTRIVSYGHDTAGAKIAPDILERELSKKHHLLIPQVVQLIALHMRPLLLKASKLKAFRKVRDTGVDIELLGRLNWADKGEYPDDWFRRMVELDEEKNKTRK